MSACVPYLHSLQLSLRMLDGRECCRRLSESSGTALEPASFQEAYRKASAGQDAFLDWSLIAGGIPLLLAFMLSLYALVRLMTTDYRPLPDGYSDRDGEAPSRSPTQRPLRMAILALVIVGTAVAGLQTGMVAGPVAWTGVGIWV